MVSLSTLWFILIGILFTGFLFLEGFDFGVGALVPFVAKNDAERQIAIGTIGPVWDGNEVWLLTAGGAMFAAFPYWYATMFSGFYLALFLVLVALIVRGVTFEFRNKDAYRIWRENWDTALSISSILPAILFPVAFANLIGGTPLAIQNGRLEYIGGFFDLLTPFTLSAGIAGCAFLLYHGAVYLALKSSGKVEARSIALGQKLGIATLGTALLLALMAWITLGINGVLSPLLFVLAMLLAVCSYLVFTKGKYKLALALNFLVIVFGMASLFTGLFPNVMISSLDPSLSLSIADAASSSYTLKTMTIITATLLPVVLLYQLWTFKVFKSRVTINDVKY
ncbi:cytochrome d ubiquinol oxidase subunit II [Fusibacter ferrireducens]|uniref:Cytochrome d ubiquinol oxidase subunit II n=1 Tax=Fusibacter ferrireducens TaxID=2785058 RepID=A0ABR9ZUT5_9FIRM|nr:cytochrome d ubiquinol oxidase subunit II [Fusibacter ferrireducens]MBF4694227.1 cytochrome d ubiquinol oxidase subunit II [Fusibacter ferrireducens]